MWIWAKFLLKAKDKSDLTAGILVQETEQHNRSAVEGKWFWLCCFICEFRKTCESCLNNLLAAVSIDI